MAFSAYFCHMLRFRTILLSALLAVSLGMTAQNVEPTLQRPEGLSDDATGPTFDPMVKVGKVLVGKDSIQYVELNNIYVYPKPVFRNERQKARYNRLVRNIKIVLPIAKQVSAIVVETGDYLNTLPSEQAKKEHMKRVEKSMIKEYTKPMKRLTYQQGKLLIKLVYRECGSSSYNLVQAFFGPTRAGFYQGVAWFFGASLTKKYDPTGVDRFTERIVRQVESGQI